MSEIKGQLLGIVLVVAIFGVVGGVLVSAFHEAADDLSDKITTTEEPTSTYTPTNVLDNQITSNYELLSF